MHLDATATWWGAALALLSLAMCASAYSGQRGQSYEWERIKLRDPETGVYYTQLTNAPVHSQVLYFEHPNFTADDRSLLFLSQRVASRNSAWDLFRVDVDGSNLVQLTDEEHPFGSPIPAPDSARVIYGLRGNALLALNVDTFEERLIARCEEVVGLGAATLTGDGTYYLAIGSAEDGTRMIVRFRTDGTETVTFAHGAPRNHLTANYRGTILVFNGEDGAYACDIDGGNLRQAPGVGQFAHSMWHGKNDTMVGTYLPPGHGIAAAAVDDAAMTAVCHGPYFWHSASSADGEWVVADTNWPIEGIYLIHVPSGRYAKLLNPPLRAGHPQVTHPHPSFNRDGTRVVFTSNETGLSQVCVIEVPEEIRQELISGELNNRLMWRR